MSSEATSADCDVFTPVFKHFRRLSDKHCFNEAFSVSTHPDLFERCPVPDESLEIDTVSLGLRPISEWALFGCKFSPDLYLLSNPFTNEGQRFWIDRCVNNYARQNRTSVGENNENQHLSRLRWATLGYHYDWTNKIYNSDDHSAIPNELKSLCYAVMSFISLATGCSMMSPEAVIINYYHLNSTLCAHTDHSEVDCLTKPLLSFSLGNAAVFLIGGPTKSMCAPSPVLLRSGDVLLMSGGSRLNFHAVPRILLDPFIASLIDENSDEKTEISFNYIRDKRININVRQVFASLEHEETKKKNNEI